MNPIVNTLFRIGCLFVYALGLIAWLWPTALSLPFDATRIALILLAIHVVELAVAFRHVRRYSGSLAASIVLTLLFGLLHWKPLADAARTVEPS